MERSDRSDESQQLSHCRNAIENIGLVDDMSCASLKRKTMAKVENTDANHAMALQNGGHSTHSLETVDNPKHISNGSVCKCDDETANHFDECSKSSEKTDFHSNHSNHSNSDNISENINNSVNEDFNDSEAVVVTEEIGLIEVISEEQVICENTAEEEMDSNVIRTDSEVNAEEDVCDLEVSNTNALKSDCNPIDVCNRFVPSVDFDGENSSLSESSSHQSSASQPTPNITSNRVPVSTTSAAGAVHTHTTAATNSAMGLSLDNCSLNESTNVSTLSGLNKKKFGKFRILNDDQNRASEDIESISHSDDTCIDSKFEREKTVSIDAMSTQSESSLQDNSEHSSPSPNPNSTPNKNKRRGRPTGSTKKDKMGGQTTAQTLLDEEDLSRRRSSRLKTLEARKEQEKAVGAKHRDLDETSGDSSAVNNSDANESQHSVTESTNNVKQKKKKSKKDKNKEKNKEKEDSKKGKRKKKTSLDDNKKNSFDEQSPEKCKTSDSHKNQSNIEHFIPPLPPTSYSNIRNNLLLTPPSSKCTTDGDETSPKPEKVKSRWRRNSELESGHGFNGDHQRQSAQPLAVVIPKETEPPPPFDAIDDNIYLFERRKSKSKKETRRMVCDCILTKEERVRGLVGCGDDCLNRMLMIECGSRCALGAHCANKRFQKKQCAKVEPFKTAKKGWGLRCLEPLQPNTFIMEYIGEVIDPLDFHNRTQKYSKERRTHHYFMALKSDEIIDATVKGNITRFVNHSCDPNSETQKWTVNGELRIGFFTQRFVQAGEEITFDYQFQRYGKEAQKCFCDAVNCRGYIGATETVDIFTDGSRVTPKQKLKNAEMDESLTDEEVLEDLALEEEIAKLSEGGGLRNRQQVLMLARLMVRAEDTASRIKLINIIKGTVEIAYLRLLLDYHGLQLVWSWMVEVEDSELKAEIMELLEILPIPNKTMLTDSKVYSVVERWSQQTNEEIVKTTDNSNTLSSDPSTPVLVKEVTPEAAAEVLSLAPVTEVLSLAPAAEALSLAPVEAVEDVPLESICDSTQTPDSIPVKTEPIEDQKSEQIVENLNEICSSTVREDSNQLQTKEVLKSGNETENLNEKNSMVENSCNKSSPRIELKGSSLSLVIKPRSVVNASKVETPITPVIKTKLTIASMAQKLLLNWKELKEVFRIPRLERQKRHEDEKEADRKTKEVEERRARGLPISYDKRGVDDRDYTIAGILGIKRKAIKRSNDPKDIPNKKSSNSLPQMMSSNWNNTKVSKEEHRKMFEMEVAQKDYQEALKRYHQQLAYYNAVYGPQYQAQQQQLYSQGTDVSEQYSNPNNSFEQYYQTNHNYYQSSANYLVSGDTTNVEYLGAESQEMVEYVEDTASAEDNVIFGTETTPVLIPLANFDLESMPEMESSLAIDSVPNDCVVYSDHSVTKTEANIFDPIYPPPGVFYVTPEGNHYFTPLPIDRNEKAVNLVFDHNITLPFASDLIKSAVTYKLPKNWRQNKDKNKNIYYFNKLNRKCQWIAPEEDKPDVKCVSPVIEVPMIANIEHKLSDTEDSTSCPDIILPLSISPKPEETEEPMECCLESTAPDSLSLSTELETPISLTQSSPNLLQSILALEADPRKRRQLLNSVVPSTTTAAADTSSSANRKKTFTSTRQIQEYFRNKMSEYVVHCLNPYRKPECKKGRILNNNDFKYLARKLTHTIMGKEIKQCKSLDNLSCNEAVKHKTKDYVKKYMARFGPFYKTDKDNDRVVSPKDIANDSND